MENTKIKLRYWFAAIYLISAHKKGISSHQLARDLGICQKTAWFMNHRIREMLKDYSTVKFKGTVSADEIYIGGKNKNRHKDKKVEGSQGRSGKGKKPVFGLLDENGIIRTFSVADTSSKTLQPILEDNIEEGSTLMTDEWKGYSKAKKKFKHKRVNHSAKQFVNGMVHVNGVENYWSHLSRSIIGIYHWVSVEHIDKYCAEMSYRFNSRKKSDCERFDHILTHTKGRLKWDNLVAH
jgi:transposase-like protein